MKSILTSFRKNENNNKKIYIYMEFYKKKKITKSLKVYLIDGVCLCTLFYTQEK